MNILHITSILPAPLEGKESENNILIRIADEYQKKYSNDEHYFIRILPYSNSILSIINKKWKEYHELIKKGFYVYNGFKIYVIGIPAFKHDNKFTRILSRIGYILNKSRIEKLILLIKPDLVHAHNLKIDIDLAHLLKKNNNINYVVTARGLNKKVMNELRIAKYIPSRILAINYVIYQKCNNELRFPMYIISHPIDDAFFVNTESLAVNKKIRFISVCRLLALKNIDKILLALSKIDYPFVYDIFGSGPEEKNLKRIVNDLNIQSKVNFKGWLTHDEMQNILNGYDLLLQPSFPETLGRVYLEAMASGVAVLASKNTGIDGIIKNGKEGYLVNPEDKNSIVNAIDAYLKLSDQNKFIIKMAATNTAANFHWSSTLKKYHEFYQNIH